MVWLFCSCLSEDRHWAALSGHCQSKACIALHRNHNPGMLHKLLSLQQCCTNCFHCWCSCVLKAACIVLQDVLEAATEAEADPQTPRTPTTEDLEYDLAGTPRQTSDFQGAPNLEAEPKQHLSRNSSIGSQVQAGINPLLVNDVKSRKSARNPDRAGKDLLWSAGRLALGPMQTGLLIMFSEAEPTLWQSCYRVHY